MRTFYIFKIKKHFVILTKHNPYNLYKTIEKIYYLKEEQLKTSSIMFENLKDSFNKNNLNNNIFNIYKNNYSYTNFRNTHTIINNYTQEMTKLTINKDYLLLRTNKEKPEILNIIDSKDIFVCDFNNKDFFWLEDLV